MDGGYRQWVKCENPSTTAQVTYFVLKGQTTPASKKPKFAEYDMHDMGGNIKAWTHGKVMRENLFKIKNCIGIVLYCFYSDDIHFQINQISG